jgi:hypothetical protein
LRNEIFRNRYAGLEIIVNGNPIARHNCIYDGPWGILVRELGQGTLAHNHLFRNREAGLGWKEG